MGPTSLSIHRLKFCKPSPTMVAPLCRLNYSSLGRKTTDKQSLIHIHHCLRLNTRPFRTRDRTILAYGRRVTVLQQGVWNNQNVRGLPTEIGIGTWFLNIRVIQDVLALKVKWIFLICKRRHSLTFHERGCFQWMDRYAVIGFDNLQVGTVVKMI